MGSYKVVKGCLLDAFDRGDVTHIGHCVNCQGVMGSGIAKSIKERYPAVYSLYETFHEGVKTEQHVLGFNLVSHPEYPYDRTIHNLHGQCYYGTSKRHLNYGALAEALFGMEKKLTFNGAMSASVGFPYKMGCDRAGGDWEIVEEMIKFIFRDHNVTIYKL